MTALTAHRRTTAIDRALLRAASALDRFVSARVERRAATDPGAWAARIAADDARTTARALGGTGILPR